MTIVIEKGTSKSEVEKLLLKFKTPTKKVGLRKHLGKPIIPENVDAVDYQRKLRDEWN
jgi:hypothetical protein